MKQLVPSIDTLCSLKKKKKRASSHLKLESSLELFLLSSGTILPFTAELQNPWSCNLFGHFLNMSVNDLWSYDLFWINSSLKGSLHLQHADPNATASAQCEMNSLEVPERTPGTGQKQPAREVTALGQPPGWLPSPILPSPPSAWAGGSGAPSQAFPECLRATGPGQQGLVSS